METHAQNRGKNSGNIRLKLHRRMESSNNMGKQTMWKGINNFSHEILAHNFALSDLYFWKDVWIKLKNGFLQS